MLTLEAFIYINLIVAFAYVIKANTGFGENMVMIPLMLLFLDLKLILPLTLTIVLIADVYLWYHSKKQIDYKLFLRLLIPAIVGMLLGVLALSLIDGEILEKIVGGFVGLYAIRRLVKNAPFKTRKPKNWVEYMVGFAGGGLSGLIGMGGPPIIAYLNYIGLSKQVFRATCIVTLMSFDPMRLIAYSINGYFTVDILLYGLALIPACAVGSFIGIKLHHQLQEQVFQKLVAVLLLIISVMLIVSPST